VWNTDNAVHRPRDSPSGILIAESLHQGGWERLNRHERAELDPVGKQISVAMVAITVEVHFREQGPTLVRRGRMPFSSMG